MKTVTIGINALVGKALEEQVGVVFYGKKEGEISSLQGFVVPDVRANCSEDFTTAELVPLTLTGELFVALLAAGG